MIKWIGQHIWDFVSRFRNDVYLESVADHGSDPDRFLTMDSTTGKVSYRTGTEVLSDIGGSSGGIAFDGSTANGVLTYKDADEATVESTLTYNDSTGIASIINSNNALLSLATAHANNVPGVAMQRTATGSDGDDLGKITFTGDDHLGNTNIFAKILAEIEESNDTDEAGKLSLQVSNDGTLRDGIIIVGDKDTAQEVDVTIGNGAASTTTIAGTLTMGSTATIDNSGAWVGGVIPSAKLDSDTAHLSIAQTFTGRKAINIRQYALPSSTVGDYKGGDVYYYGDGSTVKGGIYYIDGTNWTLADADAEASTSGLLAVALGIDPDVDGMLLRGFVTLLTEIEGTEAIGSPVYLSATDSGKATITVPASGDFVRVLGYSLHATDNQVYFNPDNTWVERA